MDRKVVETLNQTIRELAEEVGTLKAENRRLELEKTALMAELRLIQEDAEFVVFEADFLTETSH